MEAAPKGSTPDLTPTKKENRIFVGKIPAGVKDDEIKNHFVQFGEVLDMYRPRNQRASQDGLEFGFVIFASPQGMAGALSTPSHEVQGQFLEITKARERTQAVTFNNTPMYPQPPTPPAYMYAQPPHQQQPPMQHQHHHQPPPQNPYNPYATSAPSPFAVQSPYPDMGHSYGYTAAPHEKTSSRYQPY